MAVPKLDTRTVGSDSTLAAAEPDEESPLAAVESTGLALRPALPFMTWLKMVESRLWPLASIAWWGRAGVEESSNRLAGEP